MSLSFGGLYHLARNGMMARQLDMDGISNNLANIHTKGFKQTRTNFQELLNGKMISGTASVSSQADTSQGVLSISDNPLDWGIEGEGYFAIKLPDGKTGYTRAGNFSLDNAGSIITPEGNKLDWVGTVPKDADLVNVDLNGTIKARADGLVKYEYGEDPNKITEYKMERVWRDIGSVKLSTFNNPTGLESFGSNIWLESKASGTATAGVPGSKDFGQIRGYAMEESNVNMTEELTHLIRTQRGFDSASKALQKTDEMISLAIRMRQG
ncbi:MAG: flagellar hook-basal body complex protein [Leptolinea sp.]